MLKAKAFILTTALIFGIYAGNAQAVSDFENLSVPESGYYNGSDDHSGEIGSTESFNFESGALEFTVTYSLEAEYDYWSGAAYSNQTDLNTADWTNFSAYANTPDGGGADGSDNYLTCYPSSEIVFSKLNSYEDYSPVSLMITNHVWTYHYINGSDGSGSGTYQSGDYYKIIISDENQNSTEFYLADFTGGNSFIANDWTRVNLNELSGNEIRINAESSDSWTPYYFCIDNIVLSSSSSSDNLSNNSKLKVFPNPAKNFIRVKSENTGSFFIYDIYGNILQEETELQSGKIDISALQPGVYFIRNTEISNQNSRFIKQ